MEFFLIMHCSISLKIKHKITLIIAAAEIIKLDVIVSQVYVSGIGSVVELTGKVFKIVIELFVKFVELTVFKTQERLALIENPG